MAYKTFALNERVSVTIYKRRRSRSLRLSITSEGKVRVSIPAWAPYRSGLEFARSRLSWIEAQMHAPHVLVDGQAIGKAHRLVLVADASSQKPYSRRKEGSVTVTYPLHLSSDDPAVQAIAQRAAVEALRHQAEQLLPQRLATLAAKHDFTYKSVSVKRLRGRWGSCDQDHNIVLNLFLMQLPWELIDYVLIHELVHTKVLRHGPDFWAAFSEVTPHAKQLRTRMKEYQPMLRSPSV